MNSKEIEKLAQVQREMENHDNCDIVIKKRNGVIVFVEVFNTNRIRVKFETILIKKTNSQKARNIGT